MQHVSDRKRSEGPLKNAQAAFGRAFFKVSCPSRSEGASPVGHAEFQLELYFYVLSFLFISYFKECSFFESKH